MEDDRSELIHKLFVRYRSHVHGFFRRRGFPEADASELTQQTFLRVSEYIDNLRSEAAAEAWLRRIAANLWKNEVRRLKAAKRDGREVPVGDTNEEERESFEARVPLFGSKPRTPLEEALAAETLAAARACLDELPPRMRECLWLHVFQDRPYREISDLLHIALDTVKSHVHQARQQVKRCMARRAAAGGEG